GVLQELSISGGAKHGFGVRRWTTPVKLVKQDRHVFRWYATAVVSDTNSYLTILLECRQHNSPTVWCVLDSICDYVRQNTTKLFRITANCRNFKLRIESKIVSSLFGR